MEKIPERLRAELAAHGYPKPVQATRAAGLENSQGLRDVLSGRKRLSTDLLGLLATHCGVDADYITTGMRRWQEYATSAGQFTRMRTPIKTSQTASKVLDVLAALLGHFAHGLTPTDLAKATSLDPSSITRYVATLEEKGFAERIPETGRIRPSVQLARHAVSIMRSLDAAAERIEATKNRLTAN